MLAWFFSLCKAGAGSRSWGELRDKGIIPFLHDKWSIRYKKDVDNVYVVR